MRKRSLLTGLACLGIWLVTTTISDGESKVGDSDGAKVSASTTRNSVVASATSAKAEPKKLPPIAEDESMVNVEHRALVQQNVGFYAVFLPEDYETSDKRYPLAVILHGNGSTELRHGALANDFGREDVIYIAPRAPHVHYGAFIEREQPGWSAFPTYPKKWGKLNSPSFPKDRIEAIDVRTLYVDWIAATIEDARKQYRVTSDKVVIYGHSQGAMFAHNFTVAYPEMVKAYLGFAGFYGHTTNQPENASHANALKKNKIQVSLIHNEGDRVVKVEQTRKLSAYFSRHGLEHEMHVLDEGGQYTTPTKHYATPEVRRLTGEFMRRNLGSPE